MARADFFNRTQRALVKISTYPVGRDLLDLIRKRHEGVGTSGSGDARTVTIRMAKQGAEGADTQAWYFQDRYNVDRTFGGRTIKFAGKGSRTIIYYHNHANSDQIYTRLAGITTPAWVALAHELIHALHHLGGNTYDESVQTIGGAVRREEMFTTGLGPYENNRISENALRRETSIREREYYTFRDDHTHIASLAPALSPADSGMGPGYWHYICILEYYG